MNKLKKKNFFTKCRKRFNLGLKGRINKNLMSQRVLLTIIFLSVNMIAQLQPLHIDPHTAQKKKDGT